MLFSILGFTAQYPDEAHSTEVTVTVNIIWYKDRATVDAACAKLMEEIPEGHILACYEPRVNTIHAVEPTSFNDYFGLTILGHEFWHALGATHP